MSVDREARLAVGLPTVRHVRAVSATKSTSIRVAVPTRDALARQAAAAGVSLAGYLDALASRAEREQAFADFRFGAALAHRDQVFLADLQEWDEMDDGIPTGDSERFATDE